jgi:catechol 2,3-dioxygenase-like lactoylglutathione lyase family enzyme
VAALELVLGCADLDDQARFWAAALGYELHGQAHQYRALVAPPGEGGPPLILQRAAEPAAAANRLHLTVLVGDVDREADRLVALGAQRLGAPADGFGHRWVPMADPEGNEFRVCSA